MRKSVDLEDADTIEGKTGTLILGRRHFMQQTQELSTCIFDMKAYADGVVDAYCQITGFERSRLKKVQTPTLPESYSDEDLSQTGELQQDASRILMRVLRQDPICRLSRRDWQAV